MKVLLPTTMDTVITAPPGVETVEYNPAQEIPPEHRDAVVLVVWGNSRRQLAWCAKHLPQLRWAASLAAGVDALQGAGFGPQVTITSARGLHSRPVAEHALMLALVAARRFDLMHDARHDGRWDSTLGGIQASGIQRNCTATPHGFPGLSTLENACVTIWGFGSIGQTLAPMLTLLGARVMGVARTAEARDGYVTVTDEDLPQVLKHTDMLISVLPSTNSTEGIINADVFSALPSHAWFINVGRGSTVDESALVAALHHGDIGGAALDVTRKEPLPADSPLWDAPNLVITPHAAGGRPEGVAHFLEQNLAAFLAGEPLENVVDR